MTHRQEDFLSMSQVTISFLFDNQSVWQSNAPLAETIATIDAINQEIIDLSADQVINNTGIATEKKNYRAGVITDTTSISGVLTFYAAKANDIDLQILLLPSARQLKRYPGLQLIGYAKLVLDAGIANLANAAQYGLTQAMLNSLSSNMDLFTQRLNAPRNAAAAKAQATRRIGELINNLRTDITGKLDKAIVLYKANAGFYSLYKKSRIIVNSPTHRLSLMVAVADGNDKPVAGARITIGNGKEKVLRKTSLLGNIRVQHLREGEHTMTVEKEGCETQTIVFIISPPETTKLRVVMIEL